MPASSMTVCKLLGREIAVAEELQGRTKYKRGVLDGIHSFKDYDASKQKQLNVWWVGFEDNGPDNGKSKASPDSR